jgi:hypothetical protein
VSMELTFIERKNELLPEFPEDYGPSRGKRLGRVTYDIAFVGDGWGIIVNLEADGGRVDTGIAAVTFRLYDAAVALERFFSAARANEKGGASP